MADPSDWGAVPAESPHSWGAIPVDTHPPTTSPIEAGVQGAVSGATAGWNPQLSGLSRASGVPDWADTSNPLERALTIPVGAARLAYEHATGQRGSATEEYEKTRDAIQQRQQTLQKEHPYVYGGGELAGAMLPMAIAPEAEAATLSARLAQGATIGAGYGAASGASSGFDKSGVTGALEQGAIGGVEGGLGGAGGALVGAGLGKAGSFVLDKYGYPVVSAVRGLFAPEEEAARRVAGALTTDYPQVAGGKAQGMTPTQFGAARAAGEPVMIGDMGGETTRALMRSAANTSPEGRAELNNVIQSRFAQQNDRAGMTINSLVKGGANTAKTKAQLEAEYDLERGGAYSRAYDAGDKPIWSPELERLTGAPSVAQAMRGAISTWKDWQVRDGFGAMNAPVRVTEDGQLQFLPGKGMLPYPNLQLWDYTARNLADRARAAVQAGNKQEAARIGGLETLLKTELDKQVPQFADARGVAAKYFGGNNVIEAGTKAASDTKTNAGTLKLAMNGMKPAEREMFQEAYADAMAAKVGKMADNRDVTNAVFNSPAERAKVGAVFGQDGVDKMQAFVSRERIFDAARKALGNSTTARQMIEAGLAGGAAGGYLTGDWKGAAEGFLTGAGARKFAPEAAMSGVRTALGYVDRNTATRVAKLLASDDPRELMKGLNIAAKNQRIRDGLGEIASRISASAGAKEIPRLPYMQLPGTMYGQDQQQGVPRPPGQQHNGGGVKEQEGFAQGGAAEKHIQRASGGRVDAQNIDANPTEAQKQAGNYKKDHVNFQGLDLTIENARGAFRSGVDKGGKPWRVKMPAHYGYIKGTVGKDKDHVDIYLGPHRTSPRVYVIDQMNAETKAFDEHKAFLGFASPQQVKATYHKAFSDGKAGERLGNIVEMSIEHFKYWLENGDTKKPAAHAVKSMSTGIPAAR